MPRPVEAKDPLTMKPMTKPTWSYKNPEYLATSGIYTPNDIRELKERIMFPLEMPALLNNMAREMHSQPVADNEGTILKLLNEDAVGRIAESAWHRAWAKFMNFGTASAGFIAILLIIHVFKTIVDVIMRGYTLYSVFGWSLHLLGALWSSVGQCLLYSAQQASQQGNPQNISLSQIKEGADPHSDKEDTSKVQSQPPSPPHSRKKPKPTKTQSLPKATLNPVPKQNQFQDQNYTFRP